jgi:nitrite reductase/ring-hydroxylating ferredoxin subunit
MLKRVAILTFLIFIGCDRDLTDDPIPLATFANLQVNIYFPEYQSLISDGGYKNIGSIGVRGVIIYRVNSTTFIAYEKNCSYHPNEAGSTVDVHASKLYMTCSGCGSNFSFTDGTVTGGIAWRPLRKYRTEFSTPYLTITNEIAN